MKLKTTVYIVANEIPEILSKNNIKTILLPTESFSVAQDTISNEQSISQDIKSRTMRRLPTEFQIEEIKPEKLIELNEMFLR